MAWDDYSQAIVAATVETGPVGKSIVFLLLTKDTAQRRVASAVTIAIVRKLAEDLIRSADYRKTCNGWTDRPN